MPGPRDTADFSPVAAYYDASRHLPPSAVEAAVGRLRPLGYLPPGCHALDVGCGTGQLSLPLADLGVWVTGADVSGAMLAVARRKRAPGVAFAPVVADARALPFPPGSFDCVVVSKLFQHVRDWELVVSEMVRVTSASGYVVRIDEAGAFRNGVRRYFEAMADAEGHQERYLGTHDRQRVAEVFRSLGCERRTVDCSDVAWRLEVRHGDALADFERGLFAEFWAVPRDAYERMLDQARRWVAEQPGGADRIEVLHAHLRVEVHQKQAIERSGR
jgi:SAM-dependent methyltransferase